METLGPKDPTKAGDFLFSHTGEFVFVVSGFAPACCNEDQYVLRMNRDEVIDYAIKHPKIFKDGCFQNEWPDITIKNLPANLRYFVEYKKERG